MSSCPYTSGSTMQGGASPKRRASPKKSPRKTKRKLTAYTKFVKAFAASHKGMMGPALMKNAAAEWRKFKK